MASARPLLAVVPDAQAQEEEREVLLAIYYGDPSFKELSPTTYQYKFGTDGDTKSFLLEISWGSEYPTVRPTINMDTFYNDHIILEVKEKIINALNEEADMYLGTAMTYTLFEYIKDNLENFLGNQPCGVKDLAEATERLSLGDSLVLEPASKKIVKKEQLSKAQKRKQWDKVDSKGEKPRGHDWADIVKHLSQSGSKPSNKDDPPPPTS